jgi:phospholipid/cholesterol/gamma-HCH transport system ATP-binding protein
VVHEALDLDVYRGEILGVVGGSGTGKSVLLRTIAGLNTPAEGEVRVLGTTCATRPRGTAAVEASWGVMFQDGALFSSLTVRENVEVPMRASRPRPDIARRWRI